MEIELRIPGLNDGKTHHINAGCRSKTASVMSFTMGAFHRHNLISGFAFPYLSKDQCKKITRSHNSNCERMTRHMLAHATYAPSRDHTFKQAWAT